MTPLPNSEIHKIRSDLKEAVDALCWRAALLTHTDDHANGILTDAMAAYKDDANKLEADIWAALIRSTHRPGCG